MAKRIWILGAPDPEMTVIEDLLRACGERVEYALVRGERVSPAEAYRARLSRSANLRDVTEVYLVECDLVGNEIAHVDSVHRIDHHRPGDAGYGRPPSDYFAASSIGQVVSALGLAILYGYRENAVRILADEEGGRAIETSWSGVGDIPAAGGGVFRSVLPGAQEWPYGKWGLWDGVDLPAHMGLDGIDASEVLMTAAADHCLAAAYRGECPGVDPDALMRWRVETRAKHQGRAVEDILADVEKARAILRAAPDMHLGNGQTVADLRDLKIPELPEAAVRDGRAYLATVTDRDGRKKIVIGGHTTPLTVRAFLETWAPSQGLVDLYGDPARGFAGGYLP